MSMKDWKEYLWLIKTTKGDFFMTALGDWTLEEAAKKVQLVFNTMKLTIVAMIPRKRATGPLDATCTIYEQEGTKSLLGFEVLAGKKLWDACGRTAEFDAEQIRLKNEG